MIFAMTLKLKYMLLKEALNFRNTLLLRKYNNSVFGLEYKVTPYGMAYTFSKLPPDNGCFRKI